MKITLTWKIVLSAVIWCALLAYCIFAVSYCSRRNSEIVCNGINVIIKDSAEIKYITPAVVRNILVNENIKVTGEKLSGINTLAVEKAVASKGYVRKAKAYTSIDGKLNIEVEQRVPKLRIQSGNGYNIYISEDNYVLPIQRYFHSDVPVVTGFPQLPFGRDFAGSLPSEKEAKKKYGENYLFLYNLINFVEFLQKDSFWAAQIVQINVSQEGNVELVQRVGDYIVDMGSLDDYREKLDKLLVFYRKGLIYEGWNTYRYINIAYKDEVFCSR